MKPSATLGIFKRCQPVKGEKWAGHLIRQYCDQSSKKHAIVIDGNAHAELADEAHLRMVARKKAPLRPGVDFISSNAGSTVMFGGFVAAWAGLSAPYAHSDLPARLERVAKTWLKKTDDVDVKAHHLIYSISDDLTKKLTACGVPAQDALISCALRSLNRYSSWAYSGAQIGHLTGFHSDSKHPHLHVLVYPWDSKGRRLNLSRWARVKSNEKETRIDYQGFIHGAYEDGLSALDRSLKPAPLFFIGDQSQAAARTALSARTDFPLASKKMEVLAAKGGQKAQEANYYSVVAKQFAESRQTVPTSEHYKAIQEKERASFIARAPAFKGKPDAVKAGMLAVANDLEAMAAGCGTAAQEAKNAAEEFTKAFDTYALSPRAYRLQPIGNGGLEIPCSILVQAETNSTPLMVSAVTSNNHILMGKASTELAMARRAEAKQAGHAMTEAIGHLEKDVEPLFGLSTLTAGAYSEGRLIEAAGKGRPPYFLADSITDTVSDAPELDPDAGLERLQSEVASGTSQQRQLYRPLSESEDGGREYGPLRLRGARDGDSDASDAKEGEAELLSPAEDNPLFTALTTPPTRSEVDADVAAAVERYNRARNRVAGPDII